MQHIETVDFTITLEEANLRFDQILATRYPDYSRARWQSAIKTGEIKLNGATVKPKTLVFAGDVVVGELTVEIVVENTPQNIPLDVVYEDEDMVVINKPVGLVVHPAAGNPDGTVLNAVLYHYPENANLPRAGIVHRLDKDTSGLMVIARSLRAHTAFTKQLQSREMGREYLALVYRYVTAGDTIDAPIARHPKDRIKMAIRSDGKSAITHYTIAQRYCDGEVTLLRVKLETGRTHQIRVHLSENRHPLVGDEVYNPHFIPPKIIGEPARTALREFPRQALHATQLKLLHPADEREMTFKAEPPQDFRDLLTILAQQESTLEPYEEEYDDWSDDDWDDA